jgi:hypothetical protein
MFKNKPVTLLIVSGLLILLIIAAGVFQFAGLNRGMGMNGGRPGNFQPGNNPGGGNMPQDGNPPSGGNGNFQPGMNPSDASGTGAQGFSRGSFSGNSTTMKLMQLLRGVETGAVILIMLFGALAVTGIMLMKKWGRSWAIVTAVLTLVAALPSLFQRMFGFTMIGTLVKIALAIAIFVLCLLPKSRQVDVIPA